jgi:DNA transposition AAA+ family ATPase
MMVRDTAGNRAALAEDADRDAEMVKRVDDYMARTGLSHPEFARRVGYSDVTLRMFLNGSYHNCSRSADQLVKALTTFMDTHPVAVATRAVGDLYETANVRAIQETFEKLLPRPVAYMIYAPPGSQKSFVLEHQVAQLNAREVANAEGRRAFYVYARANIRPRDLMRRVALACGCRTSNDLDPMLANIRFEFRHHRVLLVVDEAQHLSLDCFETLRELLDQPPYFSLLFAGSHDLKRKFDEFSATLEQWNSRIIAKVRLPGLERKEARGIIEREIGELLNQRRTPREAQKLIDELIKGATVRDAFEGNRTYINVRTLTNALDQIKASAQLAQGAPIDEEKIA